MTPQSAELSNPGNPGFCIDRSKGTFCENNLPEEASGYSWLSITFDEQMIFVWLRLYSRENCCSHRQEKIMIYGTDSSPSSSSSIIEKGDIFGFYLGPAALAEYNSINGFAQGTHLVLQKVTGKVSW